MKEDFIQNVQFDLFSVELVIGETATLLMAENYVTIREVFVDGVKVEPNEEKQIFLTNGGDDLWELGDGDTLRPKDGRTLFGYDVSIDGELRTNTFVLNGVTYDANSFKGKYDAETVPAPANGGTLTLKNATETVISTTLTNSNTFAIALPATTTGKVNESIVIFKVGATLPTLTQPSGVVYRTETPVIAINQTWTFCYERVSYDNGSTYEIYVSATKNV